MRCFYSLFFFSLIGCGSAVFAADSPLDSNITAREIVSKCNYKTPGSDQRSRLTIVLRDQDGKEHKNVYRRYWKDYQNQQNIADKMLLVTEYPPDAQGMAFMRWGYTPEASQSAEQWIYLPVLNKIKRVSIQDLSESFLGSDLSFGDISLRRVDQDEHQLRTIQRSDSGEFFVIDSIPKDRDSQYSRKTQVFTRTKTWEQCVNVHIDYYDRRNELLKRQIIRWQNIKGAWIWDQVLVSNYQNYHSSIFSVDQVEVDIGIKDDLFTERTLRSVKN